MINILPPETKEQLRYSRLNVVAGRYLIVVLVIASVVALTLFGSHWFAAQQIAQLEADIEATEEEVAAYEETEDAVEDLNAKLNAIEELMEQRPQFAVLLEDIAAVLPSGAYINGISLSEEIDQPLTLQVTTQSQQQAVSVQDELLASERISSADIQSISDEDEEDGTIDVTIVIAFDTEEVS